MTPELALEEGLRELGLRLPPGATDKLIAYLELISKWAHTYNITAIREPQKMVSYHLLDSLAVMPHLPRGTLVDVGSGAGLPGIPIAIAEPERPVTLTESNQKKVAFLRQAKIELRLANAQVHAGRVEDWDPVERFSVVISRGFAELSAFFLACRHLVRAGGVLVAMKGPLAREESQRAGADFGETRVLPLHVPKLNAERNLVICQVGA